MFHLTRSVVESPPRYIIMTVIVVAAANDGLCTRIIIVREDPTKLINFEVQCAANSDAPAYVGTWALSIATELLHTFNDRV